MVGVFLWIIHYCDSFCAIIVSTPMRRLFYIPIIIGVAVFAVPHFLSAGNSNVLPVPFVVQAPHSNWEQPYQDACEESSITMMHAYYQGDTRSKMPADEADRWILDLVAIEKEILGYHRDTDLDDMARMINDFFPFEARVVDEPTLEQVKLEIDNLRPVVLPVWGRYLVSNPHFTAPGPTYHTILIGYDDARKQFITHESGTRHGKKFRYGYDEIMNSLQDFVPGKNGKPSLDRRVKRGLFTSFDISTSGQGDGDGDGLSKQEELQLKTSLLTSDTDHDGYKDGAEVSSGFSPTVNEFGLHAGSLVKSANDPKVFVLEGSSKRHILNEEAFNRAGYRWGDIIVVSEKFLNSI